MPLDQLHRVPLRVAERAAVDNVRRYLGRRVTHKGDVAREAALRLVCRMSRWITPRMDDYQRRLAAIGHAGGLVRRSLKRQVRENDSHAASPPNISICPGVGLIALPGNGDNGGASAS